MREVSAKVVGLAVVVSGAVVALGAGMLLPMLGGGWPGRAPSGAATAGQVQVAATDDGVGPRAGASRAKAVGPAATLEPASRPQVRPMRLNAPRLPGAVEAAARVPADADMVLVVENAAELRRSSVGAAAVRFILEASGMSPTRQAWATLAGQLGWSESETFDRLLGGRVVLVARGIGDVETAQWALLSDITLETDQRLKEQLQASQRAIDQGHQILSIEKGKYELTSHRRRTHTVDPPGPDDRVTIVLGPAGRSHLFDMMVDVLVRGADDPLGDHDVIAAAAGGGGGGGGGGANGSEVLLLARLGPAHDAKHGSGAASGTGQADMDRWKDFVVFAGGRSRAGAVPLDPTREPSEFVSRVVLRDRERRESDTAIVPTSDAVFRRLEPGSLLTVVQAAPVQQILGDAARVLDALRDVPLPEAAQRLLGARQIVSLREVVEPGTNRPVVSGESPSQPASTHLSAILALETTSTTRIAPLLDGSITRFVAAREQQLGLVRPPPRDFGGRLPGVTRVLPLELPDAAPLRLFVPDPITIAWSFPGSAMAGEPAAVGDGHPGWWLLSVTPVPTGLETLPEQTHNSVAALLAGAKPIDEAGKPRSLPRGEVRRWIWLGSIRPAALESRLPGPLLVPDIGGFRSAMKRLEHVRVELSLNDAGDIQGDLTFRLSPLAAESGAPPDAP